MKKTNIAMKSLLGMFISLASLNANAQLTESMGTLGSNGATIASHESLGRFDIAALTYSGTGTMRTTSSSNGYLGASGSINVQLLAQQTFQVQSINAALCSTADSITFGMGKSTNASDGTELKLEFSVDNGVTWNNLPFAALPTGTGTSVNQTTPKWYRRAVALPSTAISTTLWVRFRSDVASGVQNPQFRIDDFRTTCGSTVSCGIPTASIARTGDSVFCEGTASVTLTATTSLSSPSYQWYNQDGIMIGETSSSLTAVNNSGTYRVVVTNPSGCQANASGAYIKVYPAPAFCLDAEEGCAGTTVNVCATVNTGDLIISEYVEGDFFNKYLELYNGTCGTVDMTQYELRAYHNGAPITGVPTYTIPLTGSLVQGGVYVIAHRDATVWTGIPDLLTDSLAFNGNDALILFNVAADQIADIFGSVGFDPGASWRNTTSTITTENQTLTRNATVYAGILTNPALPGIAGFPTLFTEWTASAVNTVANLGSHTIGGTYTFAITGGSSIISTTGNCAAIRIGAGAPSTVTVDATFGTYNDCDSEDAVVGTVTVDCPALRSANSNSTAVNEANAYPNPFTENTMISFNNETAGNVTITLVDMQGKSVAVATDAYMQEGTHRMELNGANLNNGTYLVRVQTAAGVELFRIVKMNN